MSAPRGEGRHLLLLDYGQEGWGIQRYPTEKALKEALQAGENHGQPFLVAEEEELCLFPYSDSDDSETKEEAHV